MRRTLLLLALCGCASAGSPEDTASRPSAIFSGDGGTLMGEAPRPSVGTIAAPTGLVWIAAKRVYADLGIPLTVENPAARQLGNPDFYKIRQLGGHPMTEFVNCGSAIDGPKASTYRIYMSLLTTVAAKGKDSTTLQTTFVATGQDVMGGTSSDRIPCGSTGVLESFVIEHVRAGVGKP